MVESFEIRFGETFKSLERVSTLLKTVGDFFLSSQNRANSFFARLQAPVNFDSMGQVAIKLNSFAENMQRSADALTGFLQPGVNFEKKLAELSAGTGVTGKALDDMGKQARELAIEMGLSAEQITDVYLQNLSKLSPELARTTEGQKALADMAKTTAMLSKGMGGDVAGATDALTTMMNAYNIDMTKPEQAAKQMADIADMLTVSFKEGSVDVGPLAASMKALGASGYSANVNLSETLATLQVLGQKGAKVGAEGGVALRNALSQLGQGELMPQKTLQLLKAAGVDISTLTDKTKTFAERMEALKPIAKNDAILGEFFGKENLVGGQAILMNLAQIEEQMKKTQNATGANAAYAGVVMNTTQGVLDRMKSAFTDLGISAFESLKPYTPMIALTSQLATGVSAVLPLFATMKTLLMAGTGALFRYGLGLNFTSKGLVFQKNSLFGAMLGLARWAGTMVISGVAALGSFLVSLGAATAGTWLFNIALSANPIGVVVIGVGVLIGVLWGLMEAFGGFGNMMQSLWNFIKKFNPFSLLAQAIDYVFGTSLMSSINAFFSWVEEKIMWLWDKIKGLGEMLGLTVAEVDAKAKGVTKGVAEFFPSEKGVTDVFGVGSEMSKLPEFGAAKGKASTQKGLDGVSGGGSKATNITINLQKLQDKIEVHTMSVKEGVADIEKQVTELLLRVLNSTNQYQA